MISAIIVSILILSLYILILILMENQKTDSRKYIITVIAIIFVSQIPPLLFNFLSSEQLLFVERLPIKHWGFLIGPALFLYAGASMGKKNKSIDLFHLLPTLIWFLIFIFLDERELHHRLLIRSYDFSITVSLLSYGALILYFLRKHTHWLRDQYSYTNTFLEIKWLAYTAGFLIVHTLLTSFGVSLFKWIFPPEHYPFQLISPGENPLGVIHSIGMLIFLFVFSLLALKQEHYLVSQKRSLIFPEKKTDYKKSTNIELSRLSDYMEKSKIYLENTLTLQQLSDKSGISRNELSDLINRQTGENFFHFINGYRALEFRKILETNKYPNYNLLGIAYECGFNSKTTFISAIKRQFNKTPSQILKERGSTL